MSKARRESRRALTVCGSGALLLTKHQMREGPPQREDQSPVEVRETLRRRPALPQHELREEQEVIVQREADPRLVDPLGHLLVGVVADAEIVARGDEAPAVLHP